MSQSPHIAFGGGSSVVTMFPSDEVLVGEREFRWSTRVHKLMSHDTQMDFSFLGEWHHVQCS